MAGRKFGGMRRLGTLLALVAVGCSDPTPEVAAPVSGPEPEAMAPVEPAAPAPDPARAARVAAVEAWLSGCAVGGSGSTPRKLYTWTRAEQIDELRSSPRRALLSRERSASGEASLFDQAIEDDAHPVARRLRRPGRRARRFAWVSPWPTRMGWEEGDYGDRLIEVTLRDDAWVARFDPAAEPRWRVFDADGAEVPEDRVARTPDRVGAVVHVGDGPRAFREVVLVDERRIERWAYATEAIRERVASDAARLRELAALWREEPPAAPDDLDAWLRAGWNAEATTLEERWRSCLALGSAEYAPSTERAEAIAAALEATPPDDPIEREVPRAVYVGLPVAPPTATWCDPTMGCPP